MSPSSPIDVAAGLVFHEGRLLVTQRKAGSHLAGKWEFPGGKREANETWEACLQRELLEEVGLETVIGPLYDEITYAYPGKTVRLRFFLVRWVGGEPRALECAAWRWVERVALDAEEFPPADALLIQRILADQVAWRA